ncbi:uncharacterized protein LOC125424292 [Ziziphus jujuba]|uniref:Uncharacterized protein LOC125424292 n=1 Tax=Ziziphus jujuba TaxID=326968 RepID=A0ABM3IX02_ZIZJJ|nr:uncharacterized protein LOC125424292 [Ziziphus jujuba]
MKRRSSGSGIVGLKIDLVKAYDRVDWGLLTRIISKLAFSSKVNALILCCISPDSVELLLNGSVFSKTDMQRGLKQEDPLSLFLFTLYSELLSRMLLKLEREGRIHGIKIGRSSPPISHLLFAGDILPFCKANMEEVHEVVDCLNLFCSCLGQKINYVKSGCFLSKSTKGKLKADIKKSFGLKELTRETKYFGNPMFVSRNRTKNYEVLKVKVELKLQGWKAKLISQAGKHTLIKSVMSAIPLYTMAAAKLPSKWCNDIERMSSKEGVFD